MERDMSETETFLRKMAATQDQLLARVSSVERVATRLADRAPGPARRRPFAFPLLLSAGLAAAAVVIFMRTRPLTLELADGQTSAPVGVGAPISAPLERSVSLAFSDGSTIKLAREARARVTRLGAHAAAIVVERGRADISVVPRRGNDWAVDVGPFHVAVKGTRFSLQWDPETERFDFDLEKGKVVITAACLDRERALEAGQSLHASCRWQPADRPPVAVSAAAPAADPAEAPGARAPAPSIDATARAHAASPQWRVLASAQRYGEALAAAERGGFANECRRRDAPDLLILGDVARLAGNPARAVQAYAAARAKGTAPDRSAFAMGLVEFDQRRNYRGAAAWFATYLREQPQGPLAEQAEGRVMDAWQRAGEPTRAREAGQGYLARYPHGAYADLARRLTLR
jgi:FecR protein